MDFRVPAKHGLLDKRFIEELKLSSTFQPDSFARELKILKALFKFIKLLEHA